MGTMAVESLRRYRRAILDAAERHGARNVRVFGSIARGDDHQESDVDFLVDIEPGRTLLDVIALEQDLQQLLRRKVEVLTEEGLSPYLQQRILAEAASL
jgi:predicted nucleotidyltransferase